MQNNFKSNLFTKKCGNFYLDQSLFQAALDGPYAHALMNQIPQVHHLGPVPADPANYSIDGLA